MKSSHLICTFMAAAALNCAPLTHAQANDPSQTNETKTASAVALNIYQPSPSAQPHATEEGGAGEFINVLSNQALSFHNDAQMNRDDKVLAFSHLLQDGFDMNTISRFVLGRYWRTATPAQRKEYQSLFQSYIVNMYTARFDELKSYNVQRIDIKNAKKISDKDYLVSSVIRFAQQPDIGVEWRVRKKDGSYRIIDVLIEGISMGVTQRSDFSAVIQRGGGDIEVLLSHLRQDS